MTHCPNCGPATLTVTTYPTQASATQARAQHVKEDRK